MGQGACTLPPPTGSNPGSNPGPNPPWARVQADPVSAAARADEEILREVAKLGFSREYVLDSLAKRQQNKVGWVGGRGRGRAWWGLPDQAPAEQGGVGSSFIAQQSRVGWRWWWPKGGRGWIWNGGPGSQLVCMCVCVCVCLCAYGDGASRERCAASAGEGTGGAPLEGDAGAPDERGPSALCPLCAPPPPPPSISPPTHPPACLGAYRSHAGHRGLLPHGRQPPPHALLSVPAGGKQQGHGGSWV